MRADRLLLQRGLAPTRSAALRLIERQAVRWLAPSGWTVVGKAGLELPDDAGLEVTDDAELRFVSRGGLKLDGALARCGLDVRGWQCLDLGQSTGGFTDVLLQRGAARVTGIDVGHGQLHERLRADPRVVCHEGLNARAPQGSAFAAQTPTGSQDLLTGDLSFISLTLVLPAVRPWLAPHGHLLMLVKPQFELQPAQIGKGGLVRDPALHRLVEERLRGACAALDLAVADYFESPIQGGHGNTEFFVWARPRGAPAPESPR
ncbi:TlyA family RNA methyltransferase [Piscinibacter sakaiensis]|uniref:RNA binding methyltransferase FtsJ like n=1 Tax=Piscinibacter sakaiensis TaxID=1547922 RepID=A0A0K8P4J0_PISS1|nr:TlyA family RNA methyltransferase [Piscinibacter sakaiensis]GAP37588.1 RNA binding methyltransferase FtsJ like [Piscinibacter sakaiensis]